jgi:hypothetical protein
LSSGGFKAFQRSRKPRESKREKREEREIQFKSKKIMVHGSKELAPGGRSRIALSSSEPLGWWLSDLGNINLSVSRLDSLSYNESLSWSHRT